MFKKNVKFDCRFFDGSKPCRHKALCQSCDFYSPMGKKILIIKFASTGDVLRTTSLLPVLKKKYPHSFITWLVKEPAQELLESNPHIDRILKYDASTAFSLLAERFHLAISLDKAREAASLATLVAADRKYGFGLNREGKTFPFNREAEYSFLLGLDDELKFHKNQKTYQELIFETCCLPYQKERYHVPLDSGAYRFANEFFRKNNLDTRGLIIGINTGAGKVFANKNLRPEKIVELSELLERQLSAKILLLGGPLEKEINASIVAKVRGNVYDGGCTHTLKEFSALVNKCSLVVTADTLALHIAVALGKPVAALFGPTCAQEIELYGCGSKIISNVACAPCYKETCAETVTCMDKIKLEDIVKAIEELIVSCAVPRA